MPEVRQFLKLKYFNDWKVGEIKGEEDDLADRLNGMLQENKCMPLFNGQLELQGPIKV